MTTSFDVRGAVRDVRDGFLLAPLWWRVGLEQTLTRYRRTVLGPFWIASYTLSVAFAIAVVFGAIFGTNTKDTLPYIVSGVVVWMITGNSLTDGASLFFNSSVFMQTQKLPITFYVLLQLNKLYIGFVHQIAAFYAILLVLREAPIPHWQLPIALIVVFLSAIGLYIPLGMIAVRYRDVNFMIGFIAQALFMLTPVFWRRSQIPPKLQWIVTYNPFAHLVEIVRQPLLGHPAPQSDWLAAIFFCGVFLIVAFLSLAMFRRRVVFWL